MSETLERDFFLKPEAALDEGLEIKREMYRTQDFLDKAAEIERKMIDLAYEIPADVRSNELIESCEGSIRNIEKSDFAEYGERIDRNIKLLDEESAQAVNKLKESLSSANDKLDDVISIAEELSDEISYEKYEGNTTISVKATESFASAGSSERKTAEVSKQELDEEEMNVDRKFSEYEEMDAYLNFLMQGEHESTSYFARREEYRKKIIEKISNGEEATIELPNGMHVTFYPMPTSFRETVYIQYYTIGDKKQKIIGNELSVDAEYKDIYKAMLPYTCFDSAARFQFIDISKPDDLSADEVRQLIPKDYGMDKDAEEFCTAASSISTGISVVYLVSHSRLETTHGKDILVNQANGLNYYDFYGYGARDKDPSKGMEEQAKNKEWITTEKAIVGGAKAIDETYIEERNQRSRYAMIYNQQNQTEYQYATDIDWAIKQVREQEIADYYRSLPPEKTYYRIPYYTE